MKSKSVIAALLAALVIGVLGMISAIPASADRAIVIITSAYRYAPSESYYLDKDEQRRRIDERYANRLLEIANHATASTPVVEAVDADVRDVKTARWKRLLDNGELSQSDYSTLVNSLGVRTAQQARRDIGYSSSEIERDREQARREHDDAIDRIFGQYRCRADEYREYAPVYSNWGYAPSCAVWWEVLPGVGLVFTPCDNLWAYNPYCQRPWEWCSYGYTYYAGERRFVRNVTKTVTNNTVTYNRQPYTPRNYGFQANTGTSSQRYGNSAESGYASNHSTTSSPPSTPATPLHRREVETTPSGSSRISPSYSYGNSRTSSAGDASTRNIEEHHSTSVHSTGTIYVMPRYNPPPTRTASPPTSPSGSSSAPTGTGSRSRR